jgi:phosphate-selective porin OprO and OprP
MPRISRRLVLTLALLCDPSAVLAQPEAAPDAGVPTEDAAPTPTDTTPEEPPAGATTTETTPTEEVVPTAPGGTEPAPIPTTAAAPVAEVEEEEAEPIVELEWGHGLTVRSDDGNFSLTIRGRVQALAELELDPDDRGTPATGDDEYDPTIDFLIRRARLVFSGNLISSSLAYYVQLGLAPRDMEPDLLIPLRDAYLTWSELRDFSIRIGQMKVPFNRERVISSSALQLVDRSIVNAELTLDRDVGVQIFSNDLFGLGGYLGYQIGVFGGEGRLRINDDDAGLLYVARLQVQPFGRFEDSYTEVDFTREERARLSIGFGGAYNHLATRDRSTTSSVAGQFFESGSFDYGHLELDAIFKYGGFSAHAELLVRHAVGPSSRMGIRMLPDGTTMPFTEEARNGLGWMLQVGYLFSSEVPIEIAARWAEVRPIGPDDGMGGMITALSPRREIVIGASWYPMRHDLKLQFDYSLLSSSTELNDAVMRDTAHRFRLQMQAYF